MSIPSWAKIGVAVVCIDDTPFPSDGYWYPGEAPVAGKTYHISSCWVGGDGVVVCELAELKRASVVHIEYFEYCGYGLFRFRPAVSKDDETEAEVYRKLRHDRNAPAPLKRESVKA